MRAAGFATRGLCSDVIRDTLENHELVCSGAILSELSRILVSKFKLSSSGAEEVIGMIRAASELSFPLVDATYTVADTDDYPHLSAAENAACDVFVTGDKALWVLSPIGPMEVLSPRAFWAKVSGR